MAHTARALVGLTFGLALCAGCTGTQIGIIAVPAVIYIEVGGTATVNIMGVMDRGSNTQLEGPFTLTSSDETIVVVSGHMVGGMAEGTAIVTITDGTFTTTAVVNVVAAGTLPTQLVITPASIACTPVSDRTQLEVFAVLTAGQSQDVTDLATYTSSDSDVTLITEDHEVVCVEDGDATITVEYLGVSDSIEVSVGVAPPSSVTFSPASLTCEEGELYQVQVLASLEDGTTLNATLAATYVSSDASVAVAAQGVVQCVSEGEATIIADVQGVTDSLAVEVEAASADPDALVALSINPAVLSGTPGAVVAFTVLAQYGDGQTYDITTNTQAQYQISNTNVAMLFQGQVVCLQQGQASIQVTFGGLTATATLSVS